MMRIPIAFCLFLFSITLSFSQIQVKSYYENFSDGIVFYANNNEPCAISFKYKLTLENLKPSNGKENIVVIPANTKKFKVTTLTKINPKKKFNVRSSTWYNYGNHFQEEYAVDYAYCLPFRKGESYDVCQGYNGSFSHQKKNQLDFSMPIGTKIVAARAGIVLKVVDLNSKHCGTEDCKKYNNYIYVYHEDGTIAEYVHIKKKSATVKAGDTIEKSQIIAESGNVGWSTGPHLHFSVFLQRLGGERTYLKTKFKVDAVKEDYLVEKEIYTRN